MQNSSDAKVRCIPWKLCNRCTPLYLPLPLHMYACTWTYKLKRKSSRTPQSSSYSCNDAALWSENLSSPFIFVPRHEHCMKTRGQLCELGLLERDRSQNEKKSHCNLRSKWNFPNSSPTISWLIGRPSIPMVMEAVLVALRIRSRMGLSTMQ